VRQFHSLILFSFLFLLIFSCKKEEKIDHQNLIVSGNTPPLYNGIPTILVDNYINKMNIDLIGLKPDEITREERVSYLEENDLSIEAREKVIDDILELDEYHNRLFQINSDLLLNGMNYDEVESVHTEYIAIRDFLYLNGDTFTGQIIDHELIKLQLVLDAKDQYRNGDITLNEYFKRMCYNLIYEEINMGSENFVISCFENFYKRYPTVGELENGVAMVDGQTSRLLLKEGKNKVDFLDILISNSEFFQGRVLDAFRSLLLRDPISQELSEVTEKFITTDDYKNVQKDIAKTDEYAGFD